MCVFGVCGYAEQLPFVVPGSLNHEKIESHPQKKTMRQSPFQTMDEKLPAVFQSDIRFETNKGLTNTASDKLERYVSIDLEEVPIREALRLLAELRQMNIVLSNKITGILSLHLKGVTWEDALDLILVSSSLAKQEYRNTLLIAPISELTARQQKEWESQSEAQKRTPLQTAMFQIQYGKANDIALLIKDKSNTLLSDRGSLAVDTRSNLLWIQDNQSQLQNIKALIHRLDRPLQQVLIEARIVNVTKEFARDLGLRFGVSKPGQLSGTLKGVHQVADSKTGEAGALTDRLNLDLAATPLAATPASVGLALARLGAGILLDLELSALESEGDGEVISSPHLITLNQQTAIIEAGEEIPYQELTAHGATAVAFKKAVLSLRVTPHITADKKIYLDLKINQDIPSPKVFNGVPTILTKEIQTNVLVNNNQTIVLGGIYKQNKNHELNRVPWLGSLPVVKMLFGNQSQALRNEELLIFITPRVINENQAVPQNSSKG